MSLEMIKKTAICLGVSFISINAYAITPDSTTTRVIHNVHNVEDLTVINHDWVLGGGLPDNHGQGHLYLFSTLDKTAQDIRGKLSSNPDKKRFASCSTAPDFNQLTPHGLDYDAQHQTLYMVNHGGREAVEVFHVDTRGGGEPSLAWQGCIPAPKGAYLNAASVIDPDHVVFTDISPLDKQENRDRMEAGQPLGGLYEWQAGKGVTRIHAADKFSGPNGVVTGDNGKAIYMVATGNKAVVKLTRQGDDYTTTQTKVPFSPDNVNWTPDHSAIMVGGQASSFSDVVKCNDQKTANCNYVPTSLSLMDPESLQLKTVLPAGNYAGLTSGTGAVVVNHELWLSSTKNDRVVVMPLKK